MWKIGKTVTDALKDHSGRQASQGFYFHITRCLCPKNSCLLPPQAPRVLGKSQTSFQRHLTWTQLCLCPEPLPVSGVLGQCLQDRPRDEASAPDALCSHLVYDSLSSRGTRV